MKERLARLARPVLVVAAVAAVFSSALLRAAAISADLSVVKTRTTPAPAHPGDVIGYDIAVTNNGIDAATNVVVTDVVPANTTFDEGGIVTAPGWNCTLPPVGGTGTMTCTIASFASGASADFYLEADVDVGSKVVEVDNTAAVSSDTPDPDTTNNSSTVPTEVNAPVVPAVPTLTGAALAGLAAAVAFAGLLLLRR